MTKEEINKHEVLIIVNEETNDVEIYYKNTPLKTLIMNSNTGDVISVSTPPSFRSFSKVIKDKRDDSNFLNNG